MQKINLTINGRKHELLVGEHEMLSSVIRDKAGLTGTKIGCEQGSCGACTVLADGLPVLSCITPVMRYNHAEITTIEALSKNGEIHKLQEKFVQKGAIQCGFCTPGMIMTSFDFVSKNPNPTVHEVKEALSGNLCRCTGYKKIIEAVAEYVLETNHTSITANQPITTSSKVGVSVPYIEAEKKAKGTAQYADDIYTRNALHCKFLRSIYPHAIIEKIDYSEAHKMEGVHYIATGKEIPVKFGVLTVSQDETAMAIEKTRYIGEIVAAVVADSEEMAALACKKIKVTYKPIKEFLSIDDSLNDIGENKKIHEHVKFNNNVHKKAELRFGNQQQGLEEADTTCKFDFTFEGINHGFTEPHAATAWWDENGLTIITATQVPHYLHRALAKVMEVPLSKVRVIKPYVGGGFGGKSDPFPHEVIISYLSRKVGKPVRVRLSREEVFITNHGRHPSKMTVKMGVSNDGIIKVLDADIAIDGGAYGSFGVVTSYYNGVLLQAPYKLDNFGFRTFRVYTNKPQCGAMRGHGAVNSRFAVESTIDELAHKINMDPCELRMKNFLDSNTLTVGHYRITSNGSRESLQKVMDESQWKNKKGKLPQGKGIGVGCGFFISGSALPIIWNELPQSVVHLKLDFDGRVLITSGASDIGQGSDTMLAIIVAEVLGIDIDKIFVLAADTLITPVDLGSYSSRVTFMAGNAAKNAAENLKNEIMEAVSVKKNIQKEEIILADNKVFSNDKTVELTWEEAIDILTANRGAVSVSGKYISPKLGGDFKGAGAGLSPSYSFGACIAEVDVDMETGFVKIQNVWGAHDCGKAINPMAVEGQLEGSWHMGIGQAITEQMKYYNGLLVNNNFLDYKIPTTLDTPDIHTHIIETIDPEGPFGAKECGEGALHPVIPAIANAIYNAVGVRITKLPISAEDILEQMKKNKALEEIKTV
ncbi:MAG: molybdopterin-dependent oxidoreductase [Bacteroidetes bacterium]|nr:aldehyde oxidase [Bacteroidota bacterium]MBV6461123.1 4-hydroxybenzoyl-CoA reductase subunit alpha [Flavobacteriales bacterium]WKZ75478.1 MAG: molybdopterin-dependent oxidoreductase [Vicingaceae bacterium]MCL4815046.1 molybdopterin-dependent oxidoreductase [Flavobacteriales bacterium]NOG94847.1 molybdopterin-dependent oxidoreductase [Bacteroidota bacterium]